MRYRVIIPREVEEAIESQIVHLKLQQTPDDRLDGWLLGLIDLIDSLYELPRRFPVAEAVSAARGHEVHRANYGDYAVYFRVNEDLLIVEILAFRHGRQRPWMEDEND